MRDGKLIVPDGETTLQEGDHIYFVSKRESVNAILTLLGKKESIVERVMVIGGGRMGLRVAQMLEAEHFKVKLVEQRQDRCEELSELLKDTLILHGDGTDVRTLLEEGIAEMDAVVTVTDDEATNILAALLAKEQGAKKVMALIKRPQLLHLLPHLGIDAAVSPRTLTAERHSEVRSKGKGPVHIRDAGERCRDAGDDGDPPVTGRRQGDPGRRPALGGNRRCGRSPG